jgi:PST family polysaccharide transporter
VVRKPPDRPDADASVAELLDSETAATDAAAPPAHGRLARSAASGARWGLLSNMVQQFGRLAFTLVLARIVGPRDFGIVAQAVIYVGFVQLLLDQGFGAALIQKKNLDPRDIGSVFWLNVVSALVMAGVTVLAAPLVADFFGTPELTAVLRVLALAVLVYGLSVVPLSMINRRLGFKSMAVVDILAVVLGGVAGVVYAVLGGGYWAIVLQTMVSAVVSLIGLLRVNGIPPLAGSWTSLRAMFSFSISLFGARMVQYGGTHMDNVLVGRFLGPTELAFYALSYRMLTLPLQTFGRLVNQVAFPIFSRMQGQPDRIRNWFLLSTQATALIVYPLLTLAIVAEPDLVPLVLGESWLPAVIPMQIFTAVAFGMVVFKLVGPLFLSFGRTNLIFRWSIAEAVLIIIGVVIGLHWGIIGVAVGYLVARYLIGPVILASAIKLIGLRSSDYIRAVLPVWVSCAAMALVWLALRIASDEAGLPTLAAVSIASAAASLAYLALVRFAFPSTWEAARKVARLVATRRQAEESKAPTGGAIV